MQKSKCGLKYKKFKIGDLFDKVHTNSIHCKVAGLPKKKTNIYSIPALTAGIENQGLSCYVKNENITIIKDVISVSANGANSGKMFYQPNPFTVLQDAYAIKFKFKSLTEKQYLYILSSLQKVIKGNFNWVNKAGWNKIKKYFISLPINTKNEIDYKYMQERISELEQERISELEQYLKVSKLQDYKLSAEELSALKKFNNNEMTYKNFRIGDLFDINATKKKFNANTIKFNGQYPYVARSSINNGIRGYINQDVLYLNESNTISFGQDTATMFYQETPYFTGDKMKVMKYKTRLLNKELACFFITSMKNSFKNFVWGQNSFNEKIIKEQIVKIPVNTNNEIDYGFIENFIKAQEKLAIKLVVDFKDKII